MSELPPGLAAYKRTPLFNEATVPAGLLKDHSTKEGTWGRIHVEAGRLRYFVTDSRRSSSCRDLIAGSAPGVVEPQNRAGEVRVAHEAQLLRHCRHDAVAAVPIEE